MALPPEVAEVGAVAAVAAVGAAGHLLSKEDMAAVFVRCGVSEKEAKILVERLDKKADGVVSLQELFAWLYADQLSENLGDLEPPEEQQTELATALETVSTMMSKFPDSKKVKGMLKVHGLQPAKAKSDSDLQLAMAMAALRANSFYNLTRKDLKKRSEDMQQVITAMEEDPRSLGDLSKVQADRNLEILNKRKAMCKRWEKQRDVEEVFMRGARERFEALRNTLQEHLIPGILRDLDRYDAALEELDKTELAELLEACRPIKERSDVRLNDIYGNELRQVTLEGQDGSDVRGEYDSVCCLRRLLAEAKTNNLQSYKLAKRIAETSGGSFKRGPLKTQERMIEKTEEDNQGDYLRICDIDRSSIEFEDLGSMTRALLEIDRLDSEGELEVVRVKTRLDPSFPARAQSGGYRDVLMNYRLPNSSHPLHISELQLHLKKFLAIKGDGGHAIYKTVRSLHIFDSELAYHAGEFNKKAANQVRLGIIVQLNLQGHEPDWELLRDALEPETARVERLNLSGCGGNNEQIAGVIEAIGVGPTKQYLSKLSLAGDNVRSGEFTTLPWQKLAELSQLKELDLEIGQLAGPLPDELFQMTGLEQLELSMNPLGGTFPEGFASLSNLRVLMLNRCKLSGEIPASFAEGCPCMEILGLAENDLEPDSVVSTLCAFLSLKYADVREISLEEDQRAKIESAKPSECVIDFG